MAKKPAPKKRLKKTIETPIEALNEMRKIIAPPPEPAVKREKTEKITYRNAQPYDVVEQEQNGEGIRYVVAMRLKDLAKGDFFMTLGHKEQLFFGNTKVWESSKETEARDSHIVFVYADVPPRKPKAAARAGADA
jgi:hypothetical protein